MFLSLLDSPPPNPLLLNVMGIKCGETASPVWHLYIIRCADGSLYTGITTDVARRFGEHQGTGRAGSKYLRGRGPLVLVFQKSLPDKGTALKVENRVKRLPKCGKEEILTSGSFFADLLKQLSS